MKNRFLSRAVPPLRRILIVESGSRAILDKLVPALAERVPGISIDVVTCFPGTPQGPVANNYPVADYPDSAARGRLVAELRNNRYDAIGILCTGVPIMTKWKWALAYRVKAKLLIINENGDYFWADRGNWRTIKQVAMVRSGFSGAKTFPALTRVLAFPFTLLYLVLYAAWVHTRRRLRLLHS
jgi:hypothetical protein